MSSPQTGMTACSLPMQEGKRSATSCLTPSHFMHATLTTCHCCLYRKVDLQEHEILLKVHVPFTRQHEFVKEFKQAHRRDDDIAIVNAGMRFQMGQTEGEQCVLWA